MIYPMESNEELRDADLVLMATLVRQGYGRGVVVATGARTRFGRMYTLMKETETRKSPLQCHLDRLGEQLSFYSLGVIAVIAIIGVIQRQPIMQIFTVAVSLAVAAIPEGLPIVATITLALGVLRLSRKNVIVRRLPAVEALGSVDVLCLDKTGTITMNQLSIQEIIVLPLNKTIDANNPGDDALFILEALDQCNNAQYGSGDWHGNAVDVAIKRYLEQHGMASNNRNEWKRVEELCFTSERKYMVVKCAGGESGECRYFVKGAPEVVLPMTGEGGNDWLVEAERLYTRGLRVIAVAAGTHADKVDILGLVGMCDPPRPDIKETFQMMDRCGVRRLMVTGDSRQTALSVAAQIEWKVSRVVSGSELMSLLKGGKLNAEGEVLDDISIVYRASPEHKLLLVDALQQRQHVVAMTGDGVNDAPALKMADIGVAMGRSGTDVARAAAQIILIDDRLGSLMVGIEEGKAIFSNIRHFIRFQLSTSLAALGLIAVAMILPGEMRVQPMNAMQILLINIIMDGPPAQSLGVEPVDPSALRRPPRRKAAPILSHGLLLRTGLTSIHILFGTLVVMIWERRHAQRLGLNNETMESTRTFVVFVLFSLANALTCRSSYRSLLVLPPLSNKMLTGTIFLSLNILFAIVHLPCLSRIFQTTPLGRGEWLILFAIASTLFLTDEVVKMYMKMESWPSKRFGSPWKKLDTKLEEVSAFI